MKDLLKKVLVLLPALAMVACGGNGANDDDYDPWGEDGDVDITLPPLPGSSSETDTGADKTPDQGNTDTGGNEGGNEGGNPDQGGGNEGGGTEGGGSEGGEATEHITYIVLGENGRYNSQAGTSIKVNDTTTLEYAFKLTLAAGETLPGADKITSTLDNTTFKHFYAGDAVDTAITTVPETSGTVLTAKWETVIPEPADPTYSIEAVGETVFDKLTLTKVANSSDEPTMKAQYSGTLTLKLNDKFKFVNSLDADYVVNLDPESTNFTLENKVFTCNRASKYEFYFKLYNNQDGSIGNKLTIVDKTPAPADKFELNISRGEEVIKTTLVKDTNEGEYKSEARVELKAGDKITATLGQETLATLKENVNNFGKFTEAEGHILVTEKGSGSYFIKISADGINIFRGAAQESDTYKIIIKSGTEEKVVDMIQNPAQGKENEVMATVTVKDGDQLKFIFGTDIIVNNSSKPEYEQMFKHGEDTLNVNPGNGGTYEIVADKLGTNVWFTYKVELPTVEKDTLQFKSPTGELTEKDIPNYDASKHEYAYNVKFEKDTKFRVLFKDGYKVTLEGATDCFDVDRDGFISAKEGKYGYYVFYIKTTNNNEAGKIWIATSFVAEVSYNNELIAVKEMFKNGDNEQKVLLDIPQNGTVRFYNGGSTCNNVISEGNIFEKDDVNNVAKLTKENGAIIEFYFKFNEGKVYSSVKAEKTLYNVNYSVIGGEGDIKFNEITADKAEMVHQYEAKFTLTGAKTLKINADDATITLAKIEGKVNATNSDNFTLGAGTHTIYLKVFLTGYDIYIA